MKDNIDNVKKSRTVKMVSVKQEMVVVHDSNEWRENSSQFINVTQHRGSTRRWKIPYMGFNQE